MEYPVYLDRTEYLTQCRELLMMMKFQTTRPLAEIDTEFFFRVRERFLSVVDKAFRDGWISDSETQDLYRLDCEVLDLLEVATRERFTFRSALFFSPAFRNVKKDAKGFPLKPVRLRDLLDEKIFKGLPAIGQESTGAANNIPSLAG